MNGVHKIFRQLKGINNLFTTAFFSSVLLGVLVFSNYFTKIKYFPAENLASIIYLPIIIGLEFFLALIFMTGLFMMGPLIWIELLKDKNTCSIIVGKQRSEQVVAKYKSSYVALTINSRKKISRWYLGTIVVTAFFWYLVFEIHKFAYALPAVLFLYTVSYGLSTFSSKNKHLFHYNEIINIFMNSLKIFFFSLVSSFCLMFGILFFELMAEDNSLSTILITMIGLVFSSTICVFPANKSWHLIKWVTVTSMAVLIIYAFLLSVFTGISSKIIRMFQLGDIQNTSIIVNYDGCNILQLKGFKVECEPFRKLYKIDSINILWRINGYYLQSHEYPEVKTILQKKYVVS